MSAGLNADIMTYACMNGISVTEAKKEISKQILNRTANSSKAETSSLVDCFVSSAKTEERTAEEEYIQQKNFFKENEVIEQTASSIEKFASQLNGKSMKEITKLYAKEFDIDEEDAKEIFNEEFVSEVLGIETTPESENKENVVDNETESV